jgi:predicted metal-dependent enzyme (double-stranded beta helix superfamily)
MIDEARPMDRMLRDLFDTTHGVTDPPTTAELQRIGAALGALAGETGWLTPWLDELGGRSGAVPIHAPDRGPRLILVHRDTDQMSAVHDHGTWVAISPVRGTETHRRWRRLPSAPGAAPRVEIAEDRALEAAQTATLLPPNDVHDHGHLAGRGDAAHVLILLGDRQTRFTRNEWDAATGRHRVLAPGDGGRWLASEPFTDPTEGR